ncbi:MAG: fibronectin type III domain-containing protein [Bacteroidales bacterium]|nr:fibronectin type III domain-containing protein [Bacteroidales bacterium]
MKKRLMLLVAAITMMTLCAKADTLTLGLPWIHAQNLVPINTAFADYGFENEFIYPASQVGMMEGGLITQLTFYAARDSMDFPETFMLRMEEMEDSVTQANMWVHTGAAQLVWTGSVAIRDSLWTITLDTAFPYHGGNLLLSFRSMGEDNGFWTSDNIFYVYATNHRTLTFRTANAGHGYGNSWPSVSPHALPSVSFVYTPNAVAVCHRPLAITADSIGTHTAMLSWDTVAGADGYEWELEQDGSIVSNGTAVGTNVTLTGLSLATNYTFRVRTLCDSANTSPWIQLSFRTACGTITAADLPFFEDFESYSTTTYTFEIPCWTLLAYSQEQYLRVEPYSTGNNILSLWPDSNNRPQFAVMPEMQNIPALHMTFRVRGREDCILQVGVMTDPDDTLTFVPIAVFNSIAVYPEWQETEVDFASFTGTTGHIAFRAGMAPTQSQRFIEVDDIVVTIAPSCSQMQGISISNVTPTSADLTITDTDTAGATYSVTLASDNGTVQTLTLSTLNSTLSTLTPTTDYTVSVQKRCSDSTAHLPMTASFHTGCAPMQLPWSEGFENCGNDIPECWSTINRNGNNLSIASAVGYSSGQRSLSGYSRHTPEMLVLLPEFDLSPDSLMLGLEVMRYQHGTDTAVGVEIGIVTDTADATTFVPTAVCIPTGTWSWGHYTATFPGYTSGRIAIRFLYVANVSETAHTFVDNITVEPLPASLPDTCVQPTVHVSNIRGDGAVLHISSPTAMPHYMLYVDGDSVEIFSSLYTVTGLAADSLYTIEVCGICNDGSHTARTEVQFRTAPCAPMPLPWSENFDALTISGNTYDPTQLTDALPCWSRSGTGSSTIAGVYGTTNNRLKMTLGSYQYRNIVVLPDLQGDVNNMELSFTSAPSYPYNDTNHLLQVGYTLVPNDTASFRPVATFNAQDYMVSNNVTQRTETVGFSSVPYGARIALRIPSGAISREWYIDDVEVHAVQQCPRPQAVAAMHIGADTADLFITDTNPGQTYSVVVVSDDGTTATTTTDTLFTLTGLMPGTEYTVSVSAICDDGSLTAEVSCQFRTVCTPMTYADMPYQLDFEDAEMDSCWRFYQVYADGSLHTDQYTVYISVDDALLAAAQSGTHSLVLASGYNTPTYWVLPAIDTLDGKQLEFGYRTGWGANVSFVYHLDIGVMSDPLDPSTFLLLDSITTVVDTYQTKHLEFDGLNGGYLAIRDISDGAVHIDDLTVSVIVPPVPPTPTALQLLAVDSITATIAWQPGGDEERWQIELSGDTVQYLQHSISSYQSSVLYTLTNLAPLTTYSLRVAAVSDNDKISEWSLPLEFTTLDTVHDSIPDVGISTLSTLHSPLLYPNPSHGSVTVEVGEPAVITLFDLTGHIVDTFRTGNPQLHIEGLTAGAYFVRIVTSTGVTTRKLVVK